MPDIFGREPHEYETLNILREAVGEEGVQAHQRARAQQVGGQPHNFNALGVVDGALLEATETNPQAIQYVASNLTAIQQMADEIIYQRTRFTEMLPLNTNVPAGATTYGIRVTDRVGQGQFIDARGADAPSAGAMQRLVTYPLRYGGIVPEWTFQEIRNAMVAGFPLTMEVVEAGVDGAINHIEQVAFKGHGDFKGLVNHGDITVEAATGTFASMTGQAMLDVLQQRVSKFISDSNEIVGRQLRGGFCIHVPTTVAARLVDTRMPDGNDLTVWNFFQQNNFWREMTGEDIMLKSLVELKDAAANKTDDRMIIGLTMNDRVLEFAIPLAPRIVHVIPTAFGLQAPIEYEIAPGISMKRPEAVRYIDGV